MKKVRQPTIITQERQQFLSNKAFLTYDEIGELLNVDRSTVMKWVKNGLLKVVGLPTSNLGNPNAHKLKRITHAEFTKFWRRYQKDESKKVIDKDIEND